MPRLPFNTQRQRALTTRTVSGSGILDDFYLESQGTIVTLDVDHSYGSGHATEHEFKGVPNVKVTNSVGQVLTGAIVFVDLGHSDGTKFRLCFQRTTGEDTYDAAYGDGNDLQYTYEREARLY